MSTSLATQIFLLFYAVFYGVLFTISDRWRPFFIRHNSKEGWRRMSLSALFFVLIPIAYFLFVIPFLLTIKKTNVVALGFAIYSVAPLIASYLLWVWIVLSRKNEFYSKVEQQVEPVKSSLEWVGERPISGLGVIILVTVTYIGPVLGLALLNFVGK